MKCEKIKEWINFTSAAAMRGPIQKVSARDMISEVEKTRKRNLRIRKF